MATEPQERKTTALEFRAVVTDIQMESRVGIMARWRMALDPTGFTVGDTGTLHAVSRSGTHITIPVMSVLADDRGDLWHVVEKPLAAGTDVVGRVAR